MTTTVTADALSKNFDAYLDAAVRDPVIITKNSRPRTVLIAYEDFVRLSKRDRRVELTAELSADEIAAIEASEMEPGLDHLNRTSALLGRDPGVADEATDWWAEDRGLIQSFFEASGAFIQIRSVLSTDSQPRGTRGADCVGMLGLATPKARR